MHVHCENCFYQNCKTPGCPLVDCEHGCGAVAHQCKMEDHENVCLNKRVPCINVIYGCEVILPRHKMNVHLEHCSASVVICKFAWERVDRNKDGLSITSPSHVTLNHADYCSNKSGVEKKAMEDFFHSDMERIMKENLEAEEWNKTLRLMMQPYGPHLECYYGTDPDKIGHELSGFYSQNGRSFRFYKQRAQLQAAHHVTVQSKVVLLSSALSCFYVTVGQSRQQLHIVLRCNETIRRDEFESHYKTQHDIIHCELGGWLVHHCPLHEYGCDFSISRLLPAPQRSNLMYSKHVQKFVTKEKNSLVPESENSTTANGWYATRLQQIAAHGYDSIPVDPVSQLPTEILHIIINYLDSASLFCLSMTSQFLRDACHNAVKGNMVQLVWKREDSKWRDSQVTGNPDDCVLVKHIL